MNKYFGKQQRPQLKNAFLSDEILQFYIKRFMDEKVLEEIWPDLVRFGNKVVDEYLPYAEDVERYKPVLEKYDAWGK
jgi:hypothetical protein